MIESTGAGTLNRRDFLFGGFLCFRRPAAVRRAGVEFRVIRRGRSRRRYLRIHGNEETAREALVELMRRQPGIAYIVTNKDRLVEAGGGKLDPNRMFSRAGAERSYRRLNPEWSDAQLKRALDRLDRERGPLVKELLPPRGGLLIAVHNNSAGYSVENEIPISQASSLPRRADAHEFFLATDPRDYALIAQGPYNVVLQNEAKGEDDGSLSRLCARLGVRYVNLEVGAGRLELQKEMLEWVTRRLPE